MAEYAVEPMDSLPQMSDTALQAVNRLMADKTYRIKTGAGLLRERTDRINPDFVQYVLNDYVGHVQKCVASTRKMLPPEEQTAFYARLRDKEPMAMQVMQIARTIDVRQLSGILLRLQTNPTEVQTLHLVPFMRVLFRPLLRVYYLGSAVVARCYRSVYALVLEEFVPADPASYRMDVASAVDEWRYIFEKVIVGLYPLLLRMTSTTVMNMHDLFYTRGSLLLSWLGLDAGEILIVRNSDVLSGDKNDDILNRPVVAAAEGSNQDSVIPDDVQRGLELLENLFPEAGWERLDEKPDLCPYFQPIFQFQDGFNQLSPENPMHLTIVLLWILEQLFYGLRLIKFEPIKVISSREEPEPVEKILEDWILYLETIFEKTFVPELKEFTHQIYTQPEYHKNQYGRRLLSNMYSLMKNYFLPFYDIRMYAITRPLKDEPLAPFYLRVKNLHRVLEKYHGQITEVMETHKGQAVGAVPGVLNPWENYKFDIENPVSKRLDALCGGKQSKLRTNALLLDYTLHILSVLDWWLNDRDSFAYQSDPAMLYRETESGSKIPAFGVKPRTDITDIFLKKLKENQSSPHG